ncbi:hypothetical protein HC776_00570 [bacterium]|nr:hypothetical protein [bacterium]
MLTPSPSFLLTGTPTPLPEPTLFKSGALSFEFDEGVVRNIRLGDTLLLQAIYCAVRDHNWTTIPAVRRIVHEEHSAEAVTLVFESVHQQDDVDFVWTGTLYLTPTQLFVRDGGRGAFHLQEKSHWLLRAA